MRRAVRGTREWPLVLGMLVALGLIFAATLIAAPKNDGTREVAVSTAGGGAQATGVAPAVAAATDTPAPATGATARHTRQAATAKAKPKRHQRSAKKSAHAAAGAAPAATSPAPHAAAPATKAPPTPRTHHSAPARQPQPHVAPTPQSPAPAALSVPGKTGQVSAGGIVFTVRAPGHTPEPGPWVISASATRGGRAISGTVTMDAVFQGKVARHIADGPLARGAFSKKIAWPARAIGYPLTVRTIIVAGGQRVTLLYEVKVTAR